MMMVHPAAGGCAELSVCDEAVVVRPNIRSATCAPTHGTVLGTPDDLFCGLFAPHRSARLIMMVEALWKPERIRDEQRRHQQPSIYMATAVCTTADICDNHLLDARVPVVFRRRRSIST